MNPMQNPLHPVGFAMMLLQDRRARLAATTDRGASAIEWVVISALLIGIAIGLSVIIKNKIDTKANSLDLGLGG